MSAYATGAEVQATEARSESLDTQLAALVTGVNTLAMLLARLTEIGTRELQRQTTALERIAAAIEELTRYQTQPLDDPFGDLEHAEQIEPGDRGHLPVGGAQG